MDIITAISDEDITKFNYMEKINQFVINAYNEKGINLMSLSNWTFVFFAYYMLYTATQGNRVFGERFAWITYDPVRSNETQLNGMMYEVMLKNALSAAIVQICVMNMRTYTRGSTIYLLSVAVSESDCFFNIAGAAWSVWVLVLVMIGWAGYLTKHGANRLDYEDLYYQLQQ